MDTGVDASAWKSVISYVSPFATLKGPGLVCKALHCLATEDHLWTNHCYNWKIAELSGNEPEMMKHVNLPDGSTQFPPPLYRKEKTPALEFFKDRMPFLIHL